MTDIVVDASLALQWFLDDESDREYSLGVLASLAENRAIVPALWFYEVGNGLLMAYRRQRITLEQVEGFLQRLEALPIEEARESPKDVLALIRVANAHGLTSYDAAYLATAMARKAPLATTDSALRKAANKAGLPVVTV